MMKHVKLEHVVKAAQIAVAVSAVVIAYQNRELLKELVDLLRQVVRDNRA